MRTKFLIFNGKASDYLTYTDPSRISVAETTNDDDNVVYDRLLYEDGKVKSPLRLQRLKNLTDNIIQNRIQTDLGSPSASVRLKAIKALKDPEVYRSYSKLDVPHEEQNIITAEDRKTPPPPPRIQDVMKDVVAYVEVRYGDDNRTAGIKKHMEALGARVNNTLLRSTTIVIFNDGLLSTYKKAKNMNLPIVSILWVNACETELRFCDPKLYPISNADRYDNPELYEKIKRVKYIYPDSESSKRVRSKPGGTPKGQTATPSAAAAATPKRQATPKTKAKTTTPLTSNAAEAKGKAKTDISQYFKTLEKNSKGADIEELEMTVTPFSKNSPSQHFTNVFTSSSVNSPLSDTCLQVKSKIFHQEVLNFKPCGDKKVLATMTPTKDSNKTEKEKVQLTPVKEASSASRIGAGHDATVVPNTIIATPSKRYQTRRNSMLAAETSLAATPITKATPIKQNPITATPKSSRKARRPDEINTITEEDIISTIICNTTHEAEQEKKPPASTGRGRRRTTLTEHSMEVSPDATKEIFPKNRNPRRTDGNAYKMELTLKDLDAEEEYAASKTKPPAFAKKSAKAAGLNDEKPWSDLISSTMVDTSNKNLPTVDLSAVLKQDTPKTLLEEQADTLVFSSTRQPNSRRTLFDVGMDIISKRMENINRSARRSVAPSYGEEVLPRPQPVDESEIHKAKASQSQTDMNVNDSASLKDVAESAKGSSTSGEGESTTPAVTTVKKRKLFVPNDSLTQDLTPILNSTANGLATPSSKRRRTLGPANAKRLLDPKKSPTAHPNKQITSGSNEPSSSHPTSNKNNNDCVKKPEISPPDTDTHKQTEAKGKKKKGAVTAVSDGKPENATTVTTTTAKLSSPERLEGMAKEALKIQSMTSTSTSNTKRRPGRRSTMLFEKNEKTMKMQQSAQQALARDTRKVLVYTNMHVEQINAIREALTYIGGFRLDYAVNNTTTHLVSLEPRRTLNMLRALIRGLWILDFQWVVDSHRNGQWLPEEPYEMKSFSRAVEICRTERQAFKEYYQCDLFRDLDNFYISSESGPLSKANLKELVKSCGGRLTEHRNSAKYIISTKFKGGGNVDSIYVSPFWLLDSITQMQLLPYHKYSFSQRTYKYTPDSPYKTQNDVMRAFNLPHIF